MSMKKKNKIKLQAVRPQNRTIWDYIHNIYYNILYYYSCASFMRQIPYDIMYYYYYYYQDIWVIYNL